LMFSLLTGKIFSKSKSKLLPEKLMKKNNGLRWWIIGLIALATIINYIDRITLSLMWPSIYRDLGMDKCDYAVILNVFMAAYAVGQLVRANCSIRSVPVPVTYLQFHFGESLPLRIHSPGEYYQLVFSE